MPMVAAVIVTSILISPSIVIATCPAAPYFSTAIGQPLDAERVVAAAAFITTLPILANLTIGMAPIANVSVTIGRFFSEHYCHF
jgi:hypothetical protein